MNPYRENVAPIGCIVEWRNRLFTGNVKHPCTYVHCINVFSTPDEARAFALGLAAIQEWDPDVRVR